MIDGIRRRFTKSAGKDHWDAEEEFETQIDEASEVPTETAVLVAPTQLAPPTTTIDVDTSDYYKKVVRTAIENGGRYGDHQISIPWLRMILGGLESKPIDPESIWYGTETSSLDAPLP
jgi:hypothetical protein